MLNILSLNLVLSIRFIYQVFIPGWPHMLTSRFPQFQISKLFLSLPCKKLNLCQCSSSKFSLLILHVYMHMPTHAQIPGQAHAQVPKQAHTYIPEEAHMQISEQAMPRSQNRLLPRSQSRPFLSFCLEGSLLLLTILNSQIVIESLLPLLYQETLTWSLQALQCSHCSLWPILS